MLEIDTLVGLGMDTYGTVETRSPVREKRLSSKQLRVLNLYILEDLTRIYYLSLTFEFG